MEDRSNLRPDEWHPSAESAREWLNEQAKRDPLFLSGWSESFASCAIEGNRLAEVCSGTLRRIMSGEKISDRYLLGLVWAMRYGDKE